MRPNCLFLALFLFAFLLAVGAVSIHHSCHPSGDPQTDKINNPVMKDIAEFAISEINKQSQKKLVFQKVVSRRHRKHLEGRIYRLFIEVRDESLPTGPIMNYKVYVYEICWKNFRKLKFFYQIN
ncbi:hypothetical protein M0R45_020074 [Rubus argutus]|uniref:Cystatin domain-containing protein n=1 Tax=Rubus argutus TaxID=59490 RepID=A0AAW1XAN1_RUBAR